MKALQPTTLLAVVATVLLLSGCTSPAPSTTTSATSPTATTSGAGPTLPESSTPRCRDAHYDHDANITIRTSKGEIGAILYGIRSPITVCNFLGYVSEHYFDNTVWYRICPHVIQTGGQDPYTGQMKQGGHDPIVDEAPQSQLRNYRGTLGMARDSDPATATSEWYINNRDNNYLDYDGTYAPGYAVFGNVTKGWSVEQDIADTQTVPDAPTGCDGRPVPNDQTTILGIDVNS